MRPERRQPSPDPTDDMRAMLETLLERQERADARNSQILALLERIVLPMEPEPAPEPEPVPPLVQALGDVFGAACFTARQAWQRASDDAARAQACGEPEPMLSAVLRDLGVYCPRGLGYHLRCYEAEGAGIGRGGQVHHVNSWEVLAWARRG